MPFQVQANQDHESQEHTIDTWRLNLLPILLLAFPDRTVPGRYHSIGGLAKNGGCGIWRDNGNRGRAENGFPFLYGCGVEPWPFRGFNLIWKYFADSLDHGGGQSCHVVEFKGYKTCDVILGLIEQLERFGG